MKTYQFTAFRDKRFAANGEVKADSPKEAKAKILGRYHQGDLIFCEYVDGEEPDHIMFTDEAGEECHLEDETPPDVFKALKALIEKADECLPVNQIVQGDCVQILKAFPANPLILSSPTRRIL